MATKRTRMSASERREQLIAVARGLFAERGFDATIVVAMVVVFAEAMSTSLMVAPRSIKACLASAT